MSAVPRLSVGLPVYNGENYLAESLEALLGQSYGDFELIISDNASTDGTAGYLPTLRASRTPGSATSASRATSASPPTTTSSSSRPGANCSSGHPTTTSTPATCSSVASMRSTSNPRCRARPLLDGDDRRLGRRDEGDRVPAGDGLPAGAGALPEHAVRRRRRRRRRRHQDEGPAPDGHEGQLPPRGPDHHRRARPARPVLPGPGLAVLPPRPPRAGRAGVPDHALPVREHGSAPGGPAAAPGRPPVRRVRLGLHRGDPACAAVACGPAGVLPLSGAVAGEPGPSRRRPARRGAAAGPTPPAVPGISVDAVVAGRGEEASGDPSQVRRHRRSAAPRGPRAPRVGLFGLLGSGNIGNDGVAGSGARLSQSRSSRHRLDAMCTRAGAAEGPVRRRGHPPAAGTRSTSSGIRRDGARAQGAGQGHRRFPDGVLGPPARRGDRARRGGARGDASRPAVGAALLDVPAVRLRQGSSGRRSRWSAWARTSSTSG